MDKTLAMLYLWEEKYKELGIIHFWKEEYGICGWFYNELTENGFKSIGAGQCAFVYKHPKEDFVIKYCNHWGEQSNFWWEPDYFDAPWFLPYKKVSSDGFCAIQEFADCSDGARKTALFIINKTNPHNKHFKNMGMKDGNAVIIDAY